jgi:HSP20 family molecular chaperone IbpA
MSELMEAIATRCLPNARKPKAPRASHHEDETDRTAFIRPRYHYQEQSDTFRLVVHVPGVDPTGIDLEVNAPDLTITATREHSPSPARHSSHLANAMHDYQLRLRLGFSLAYNALQADLHGGTLTVTIPKKNATESLV